MDVRLRRVHKLHQIRMEPVQSVRSAEFTTRLESARQHVRVFCFTVKINMYFEHAWRTCTCFSAHLQWQQADCEFHESLARTGSAALATCHLSRRHDGLCWSPCSAVRLGLFCLRCLWLFPRAAHLQNVSCTRPLLPLNMQQSSH